MNTPNQIHQEIRMLNLDASSGALPMCTCAFPGMNATWFDVPSCRGPKSVTRSVLYLVAKNKSTVFVRCSKDIEGDFCCLLVCFLFSLRFFCPQMLQQPQHFDILPFQGSMWILPVPLIVSFKLNHHKQNPQKKF